jgi:hypothetical protein
MPDLVPVHDRLKRILAPYRDDLVVTKDGPEGMALEVPGLEGKPWGYVAGTRLGKRYVSFYLMPVYASPELKASISPELRRRMQGKACFNFTSVDEVLFEELSGVAARGIPGFRAVAESAARPRSTR